VARILVVDDDPLVRELVAAVLGEDGHDVVEAPDGAAGLALFGRLRPDLVLLDLRMPELDGWGFAARYRALPAPRPPLVLLTTAMDVAAHAAALDADGWIEKPFPLEVLLSTIRQHLDAARMPGSDVAA
jgi:two-component system chemotaxis response regulator CheY